MRTIKTQRPFSYIGPYFGYFVLKMASLVLLFTGRTTDTVIFYSGVMFYVKRLI